MSYSFTVTAATKQEAVQKAVLEFDAIVAQQPIHSKDREYALANVLSAVEVLGDDEAQDVRISANGSVSYRDADQHVTGVSICATAWHVPKSAA